MIRTPIDADQAAQASLVFKALADPTRLHLLHLIQAREGGTCVGDLVEPIGVSQPTVSYHLNILYAAGLVTRTRRGVRICYEVVPSLLTAVDNVLTTLQTRDGPGAGMSTASPAGSSS